MTAKECALLLIDMFDLDPHEIPEIKEYDLKNGCAIEWLFRVAEGNIEKQAVKYPCEHEWSPMTNLLQNKALLK